MLGVMVTKLMRPVPGSLPALAMLAALLVVGLAGKAVADSVSLDAMADQARSATFWRSALTDP